MSGCVFISSFDHYCDLPSVPAHRQLRDNNHVEHLRRSVPFAYVSVSGLDIDGYRFGNGRSIDTDAPPAFVDTYFAERLGQTDPVVVAGKAKMAPLRQEEAYDLFAPSQRLLYLTRTFDIQNRILIPLTRGDVVYGAACFAGSRPFTLGELDFLALLAEPLHREITKPLMERFAATALRLTAGELTCLRLAGAGLNSEEIADASKYRTETVNSYLKSATKKLGTANRVQAVAEAIQRRLIEYPSSVKTVAEMDLAEPTPVSQDQTNRT